MNLAVAAASTMERAALALRVGRFVEIEGDGESVLVAAPGCVTDRSLVPGTRPADLCAVLTRSVALRRGVVRGTRVRTTIHLAASARLATVRALARPHATERWFARGDDGVAIEVVDDLAPPVDARLPSLATTVVALAGLGSVALVAPPSAVAVPPRARLTALTVVEAALRDVGPLPNLGAARLPTPHGDLRIHALRGWAGQEHVALTAQDGDLAGPVHVVEECRLGQAFGTGCGCAARLDAALTSVASRRVGVVLYLRTGADRLAVPTDRGPGMLGCPASAPGLSPLEAVRRQALVRSALDALRHPAA